MRLIAALPAVLLAATLAGVAAAAPAGDPATRAQAVTQAPADAPAAVPQQRLPRIALHGNAMAVAARTQSVEELDQLAPATTWVVSDPFRRHDISYSGILLRDLVVRLAPKAEQVRMRAVNDYVVTFTRAEWETLPIMLATRDDGRRMAVADKGPARIVYRQTRENALAMQVHAPKWIWQVIDVEFRTR